MTAWKTTLLAIQWLLLSAQSTPDVILSPAAQAQELAQAQEFAIETRNEGILRLLNMLPPKELDREFLGRMEIYRVNEAGMKLHCPSTTEIACTHLIATMTCFVWIANDDILARHRVDYDIVYRHERAHCFGWHHR